MAESKTIYCPKCGRKITCYDGKQTINPMGKCRKCNKLVVYDIVADKVLIKKLPERTCSSGLTFY